MAKPDPLADALLKIKRANKHVKKVGVLAHNYIQARPFRVLIEHDPTSRRKLAKLRFVTDVPDDLADEAHIAVHGFRASLDSIAWAAANRSGPPVNPKSVQFPITETQKGFEDPGFQGHIAKMGSDWASFVTALKPYPGGNDLLVTLNRFDIADKHRYLTRIGQSSLPSMLKASFSGSMSFNVAALGFALEDGMELMAVGETDPDPDVQLTIKVAFCEIGGTMGKPVVGLLEEFSRLCTGIVNAARPLFP